MCSLVVLEQSPGSIIYPKQFVLPFKGKELKKQKQWGLEKEVFRKAI